MNRNSIKKLGRRKAGTWGRTHGPSRGNTKRAANKAVRKDRELMRDGSREAAPASEALNAPEDALLKRLFSRDQQDG